MLSEKFQTFQIGEDSLVIKVEPVYGSPINDFSSESTANVELISSHVVILFQNQLIHANYYPQEQCIVFEEHPKKIFNGQISLVFRVLKEVFKVKNFYLKNQFQK